MRCLHRLLSAAVLVIPAMSYGQTDTQATRTETETTITGEVIRFEPGKVIVIRQPDQKTVTFTLTPSVTVPQDVQVGRKVMLYTEPGEGGTALVKRVTTTSITPDGKTKQTTEETRTSPGGTTTTTTTSTVSGVVSAYESGKSITVTNRDGTQTTYVLSPDAQVPADLATGKTVTIMVMPADPASRPMVKKIIYKVETKQDK
jgi:hypothetical protein